MNLTVLLLGRRETTTLEQYRFAAGQHIRRKLLRLLLDSHALDIGDGQQMRVLEGVRGKLIKSMTEPNDMFSRTQRYMPVQKHSEFDSKDTMFGHAADIAAGIASIHFRREGDCGSRVVDPYMQLTETISNYSSGAQLLSLQFMRFVTPWIRRTDEFDYLHP